MFCPNCGKNLADGVRFCDSCGTPLGVSAAPAQPAPAPTPQYQQPQYQAQPQYQPQGQYPPGQYAPPAPMMVQQKSEFLAFILSVIIPGLGQFYVNDWKINDHMKKGIFFLVGYIVLWVIDSILWGMAYTVTYSYYYYATYTQNTGIFIAAIVLALVILVYVLFVAYDAYKGAKQYNQTIAQTGRPPM